MDKIIKKDIVNGVEYKYNGIGGGGSITDNNVIYISQADYDNLTPAEKADTTKNYVIIGQGSIPVPTEIDAEDVNFDNTGTGMQSDNVQDAIEEVFQSVSNGKELIADAITDKGVSTSATDSFQTMASNIALIQTGGNADHIINNNTGYGVVLKTKEAARSSSFNNIQLNFNDGNLYLFGGQYSGSSNYELNFAVVFIKEDFTVQTLDCSFTSYSGFPNQQIYVFTKNGEDNTMYVGGSGRYPSGMGGYSTGRMSMLKYNTTTKERTTDSQVFGEGTYTIYSTLPDPIINISYNVPMYTGTDYFVKQFVVFNS